MSQRLPLIAVLFASILLSGCVVAKATGKVVGGTVKATGAVIGGTVDVLTPDGDDDEEDNSDEEDE